MKEQGAEMKLALTEGKIFFLDDYKFAIFSFRLEGTERGAEKIYRE